MVTDAPERAIRQAYGLMHMNATEDEDLIEFLDRALTGAGFWFAPLTITRIEF